MRSALSGLFLLLVCLAAQAADAPAAIYDADPGHLWNRLYRAIAVRTEAGVPYGADISEPYYDSFDDPKALVAVLDEFLRKHGENLASGDLRRALLLSDVWAAFDIAANETLTAEQVPVRRGLAQVIGRLRLRTSAGAALPDNYAQAVKSGQFAGDFDPEHPERGFLPPDLFDPNGSWVEVSGADGGLVTPLHVGMLSGRSVFKVFIRCPGGHESTLAYLQTLNLYPTPWELKPADIATRYPSGERVRSTEPMLDLATPQFPPGTMVALVRQMLVINDALELEVTPITQKVQFRVFRKIDVPFGAPELFATSQSAYEFVMRRADLLAGKAGGLQQVGTDDVEYQRTIVMMGESRAAHLRGTRVMGTCVRCHSAHGIFAVRSYSAMMPSALRANPQLAPVSSESYVRRALDWKTQQFNWGLLLGLLEGAEASRPRR